MRKTILFLVLGLCSSCEEEVVKDSVVGQWNISWTGFNEVRKGKLLLNSDHTGRIVLEANSDSRLLSEADDVNILWKEMEGQLIFTRLDNKFQMSYRVIDKSEKSITLMYMDDLQVSIYR